MTDLNLINKNPFVGKIGYTPRPTEGDRKYDWTGGRDELTRDQTLWDAARDWAAENDQLRLKRLANVDAERAADHASVAERDNAQRMSERAALEGRLRAQFMANPAATSGDWERVKDDVITRHLSDEATRREAEMRRSYSMAF